MDVLLGLLEKIYTTLQHYSPALQQYFEVTFLLGLISPYSNVLSFNGTLFFTPKKKIMSHYLHIFHLIIFVLGWGDLNSRPLYWKYQEALVKLQGS